MLGMMTRVAVVSTVMAVLCMKAMVVIGNGDSCDSGGSDWQWVAVIGSDRQW